MAPFTRWFSFVRASAGVLVVAAQQCLENDGAPACSQARLLPEARPSSDADARSSMLLQVKSQRNAMETSASSLQAHALIEEAAQDVADLVKRQAGLAAKFLRLGFHDCVGGCDGCVDMSNPDNKGLEEPISALEGVVRSATVAGSPLSRADVWALATMVAAQQSTRKDTGGVGFAFEHYGRVNCEDSPECASGACGGDPSRGGPARVLPSADLDNAGVLKYFADNFGFNPTQTVALMGAHGIGKTHLENSGFGVDEKGSQSIGWVYNNRKIGTSYYDVLVGQTPDDIFFTTDWIQHKVDNSALRAGGDSPPDRIQWEHQKARDSRVLVMLNSDIAMVRDFASYFDPATGNVTCQFRGQNPNPPRLPKQRRRDRTPKKARPLPPVCPAASTLPIMAHFKFNPKAFFEQFDAVLREMVTHGYTRDRSCKDVYCQLVAPS